MPQPKFSNKLFAVQILGLILSLALASLGQTSKSGETQELPPNQVLAREMTGAETHRYRISLEKDEFFQVRAEQKGVDIALKLTDATGKALAEMDSPNEKEGAEILSFIAGVAGEYVLEISGFDPKAEKGNYTIRREAARTATAADKRRVEVERFFVEGLAALNTKGQETTALTKLEASLQGWQELKDSYLAGLTADQIRQLKDTQKRAQADAIYDQAVVLGKQGTKESLRASISKFTEAQKLYIELDDKPDEAITFNQLGFINGHLGELRKALEYFNQALPLYKDLGDKIGQANVLGNMGDVYGILGDSRKALEFYNQSLPIIRSAADKTDKDKRLEARTLYNTAAIYLKLSETQKAHEYLTLALSLCRENGFKDGEAITLNNFAALYSSLGDKQKALGFYNQALTIIRAVTDKTLDNKISETTMLNNIGGVYADLGDRQKALEYFNQALPIVRSNGDKHGEANTLHNFGYVYSSLGEKQKALDYQNQALALIRQIGDRNAEAAILGSIGLVYANLGEKQKAIENYNQALIIQKDIGDRTGEVATINNIGRIYIDSGDTQKALEFCNQSLLLTQAIGDRRGEGSILNNIGKIYWDLNENQKALEYYNRALPILEIVGDKEGEAITLNNIGAVYNNLADYRKAIDYFNEVLPMSTSAGDREGEATTFSNMMYSWELLKNTKLAILYGKQSINVYQSLRADIKGLDKNSQQSFLGTIEGSYRASAKLLIKEKRFPEAERVLRMLKEEEYFEFTGRDGRVVASLDERINLNPAEREAAEQFETLSLENSRIYHEIGELEKQKALVPAEQSKSISEKQAELNKNLELSSSKLQNFLAELSKDFDKKQVDSKSVEESSQEVIKEWNDPRVAVISTVVERDAFCVIVTTSAFQHGYVLPISEEKLESLAGDFRTAILEKRNPQPAAQALYDVLIKPIEKDLESANAQTLVWSLDKFLRYTPVSALWDKDKGYLVQNYASVVLAMAGRQNLAFRPTGKNQWQALGAGMSKKSEDLEPLIHVPEELEAIVREPNSKVKTRDTGIIAGRRLLNEQFTYDSFTKSLKDYRFAHVATHFKFISGTKAEGLNSFLLMGDGSKLTLAQIQNSDNIFAGLELLTLSACDTGYGGKTADGREIEGFGVLAQRKGARAIMATLWNVDDESTRDLMIDFYGDYEKPNFTKAEALRQAQLALLQEPDKASGGKSANPVNNAPKRFAHPFYWSPFILIGNWR